MNKVNFFVVGFPRTGTTSLYNFFQTENEIYVPNTKQLYHFEKDFNKIRYKSCKKGLANTYNFDIESYNSFYKNISYEKIIMDITPSYIFSEVAAEEIKKYNSEAKILILLREPISFLMSYFNIVKLNGIETENSLIEGLELEEERKKKKALEHSHEPISFLYYRHLIKYHIHISRFLQLFPKKNIKILVYEEMEKNTKSYLNQILDFMGLESSVTSSIERVNQSSKSLFIDDMSTLRNSRLYIIKKLLPASISGFLTAVVKKLLTKDIAKDEEQYEEVYQVLCNEVKDCVQNTKNLLDEYSHDEVIGKIHKYWNRSQR